MATTGNNEIQKGSLKQVDRIVYQHAQRHKIIPAGVEHNPARARNLGGPKIKPKPGQLRHVYRYRLTEV
jgi:hypothetical protein